MKLSAEIVAKLVVLLLTFAASVPAQSSTAVSSDLLGLAATERAFAAATVKVGFRDGFIKYFADDGIGFGPHPERTREKLLKLPPPTGPRTVIFNWAPMFGDISDAGDLGYTTGPVLYTDISANPKPPHYGMYFSVWQKQPDGSWKVVVDMGVDTPEEVAPLNTTFTAADRIRSRRPNPMKGTPSDDYRKLDWNLSSAIEKTNPAGAYASHIDKQFRIHRKGVMPLTGAEAYKFASYAAAKFEIIDGKISTSDDLAFTYGKYTATYLQNRTETGYYVHVWRRDAESKWRLAVVVQNPLREADK